MPYLRYRSELKHVVSAAEALVISARISGILYRDLHAGPDGQYLVRSLYFDTPEDRALSEKLDGLPVKEKFRIRFYNHDHSFILLEKKIKCYGGGGKLKAAITREDVQSITGGNIGFLRASEQPLLREFYLKLKLDRLVPKTVVDYTREAYCHPAGNVRVTLDRDIRASISSVDLFDQDLATVPVLESGKCILEVKYDGFLPEFIQDIVQVNCCASTPVSKYAAGRVCL